MVRFEQDDDKETIFESKEKKCRFSVNDNIDVLIEILQRLDGRALGVAACVCRLWCGITRNDSLWAHLCFQASPPTAAENTVVLALGGYKRLYMGCVRPVLHTLRGLKRMKLSAAAGCNGGGELKLDIDLVRRVWTRREVDLALSLFCVDYYERALISGGGGDGAGSGKVGGGGDPSALSLMFLCNAG